MGNPESPKGGGKCDPSAFPANFHQLLRLLRLGIERGKWCLNMLALNFVFPPTSQTCS